MGLHKEGIPSIILISLVSAGLVLTGVFALAGMLWLQILLYALAAFLMVTILQFFRKPDRTLVEIQGNSILSPCDGKVVVIEEVDEPEFFQDKRIQISVFMSPINVHINWAPITGLIKYVKYHPGKYLVAWHPKSSTENERTTIVLDAGDGKEVMIRQIAGALARRIVWYAKENTEHTQGAEVGFIKFGSRVDVILPVGTKVHTELDQVVTGNRTVLASWD